MLEVFAPISIGRLCISGNWHNAVKLVIYTFGKVPLVEYLRARSAWNQSTIWISLLDSMDKTRSLPPATVRTPFAEPGGDNVTWNELSSQMVVNKQEITDTKSLMVRVANTRSWCLVSEELWHCHLKNWPFSKGIISWDCWLCCV